MIAVCDALAEMVPSDLEAFAAYVAQRAVEMGLIRIGKAVDRIHSEVLELLSELQSRPIVATRNFVAHQYDDLDLRLGLAHVPQS